jgi:hypothetical protein
MTDALRPIASIALIVLATNVGYSFGSQRACAHCGCSAECGKFCRLVCEEKKVEVFCYGCKREEFCVPCASKPGRCHCECVCDDCEHRIDPNAPVAKPKRFIWFDWFSGSARVYTRVKLVRKTETVTMPSYRWVVEDLCPDCAAANDESLPALSEK